MEGKGKKIKWKAVEDGGRLEKIGEGRNSQKQIGKNRSIRQTAKERDLKWE